MREMEIIDNFNNHTDITFLKTLLQELVLRITNSMGNFEKTNEILEYHFKVKQFLDLNKKRGIKKLIVEVSNYLKDKSLNKDDVFERLDKMNELYFYDDKKLEKLNFIFRNLSSSHLIGVNYYGKENFDDIKLDTVPEQYVMVSGIIDIYDFKIDFSNCYNFEQMTKEKLKTRGTDKVVSYFTWNSEKSKVKVFYKDKEIKLNNEFIEYLSIYIINSIYYQIFNVLFQKPKIKRILLSM